MADSIRNRLAELERLLPEKRKEKLSRKTPSRRDLESTLDGRFVSTPSPFFFRTYKESFFASGSERDKSEHHAAAAGPLLLFPDQRLHTRLDEILFIDTETTGLAGGTGTYAFLIGVGYFTGSEFHVEQLFMRDYNDEPGQLAFLAERLKKFPAICTYNGKAFDVPLLRNRLIFNRIDSDIEERPHFDLLFPARRLWKSITGDCRLSHLESEILQQGRGEDIPGHLIPHMYFNYLTSGDPRPLRPVFRHNQFDIVTLAKLFLRICAIIAGDDVDFVVDRRGLARLYGRSGKVGEAISAYEALLKEPIPPGNWFQGAMELATMYKKQGEWPLALTLWERCKEAPLPLALGALQEQAKHFEHREKDLDRASRICDNALSRLSVAQLREPTPRDSEDLPRSPVGDWLSDWQHRQSRIQRKIRRAQSIR